MFGSIFINDQDAIKKLQATEKDAKNVAKSFKTLTQQASKVGVQSQQVSASVRLLWAV